MTPLDPAPIIELATAYWGSAALIAAVRLDVFTHLAEGPATPVHIARDASADPVATEALLTALSALRLVHKDGDTYRNTPLADAYLVRGRPGYLGSALLYNGDNYPLWAELDAIVRDGKATAPPAAYLGDDEARTRNFVYGMHHRALGVGRAVASVIDLTGRARLADVGGGPGTYSALLTDKTPGLRAEVLDLPGVVAVARDIIKSLGASERVEATAFDYYKDALPGTYDCALISGVLHREQPDGARALIAKTVDALEPGGLIYISDVMLADDRAGPLFPAMFALNMRVMAHDGRSHTVAEQTAWLAEVGCTVETHITLPAPIHYTVIRAEKTR